ncbi:MAG: N-acetyltransferase [Thermoanaerobaculales bacterium]
MTEAAVRVMPVGSRAELRAFVDLPWRLYAGDPCWVPPLKKQVRDYLDEKHPFYANGAAEREVFLAWRGGRVAGRITAILNRAHNRVHDDRWGFFGFFECEDDSEAAEALFAAAAMWLRARGCDAMVGPANPSTNYECGLLVKGFDTPPSVMMTYNPPRYAELIEGMGFVKAKDLNAYSSPVHPASLERLQRFTDRARRREPQLHSRAVNLKDFAGEVQIIRDIYNKAWEKNWGFVPVSEAEFAWLAKDLKPLVDPPLMRIAFMGDDPAGFLLALPDVNPALAVLNGTLANPLRLLRATLIGRRRNGLRLITMGVKEQYRLRGAEGVMFCEGLQAALDRGYKTCEYSWILEDNELAKRTVRLMDAELSKVYRIYSKPL